MQNNETLRCVVEVKMKAELGLVFFNLYILSVWLLADVSRALSVALTGTPDLPQYKPALGA